MNRLFKSLLVLSASLATTLSSIAADAPIMATPDHPNGVYREGEPIHWQVKTNAPAGTGADAAAPLSYVVKKGGLTPIAKGTIPLDHGMGTLTATLPEAGTMLVEIKGGAIKGFAGAVVAPEKLKAGVACPDDFDAFWNGKLAELDKIPANPALTPAASDKEGVQYEKVTLDNINGTHVQGQIARPTAGGRFPAILQLQYAGVYPLQKSWVTEKAAKGWLALNILAHDLPIDEPADFYQKQNAGPLKNYTMIGNESRETSYFLHMLLGDHRAAEYLASRPDWDGKTLVVIGTSQGGIQSFFTAAYFPKVSAVMVEVPAGCDPGANAAGRAFGWPYWGATKSPKVMETSRYYDACHFAARTKCALLVGVGLIDTTSPAGAVYAAFNSAQGPKEIVPMPLADHKTHHQEFAARREQWLKALLHGQPAPIAEAK
ncbi:Acetyl xylan esterase [Chthoniobacter flavus Ellin428]|uniref:Acetyl xylan esterase n=1 Tax=Chthoniobacter flavus Ellin428 TaxID=497964 RepID=B4D373_9BACT|nr:acetylxylan esterase [Chthoniobacter flavus]EDY19184.1 Acetyl xylan esterase [Chthoniobacter flavus Ellin428]TCO88030.1 cephalosporin-C deacetylase-like acetyl esterase [Chthoniobacter flavus]